MLRTILTQSIRCASRASIRVTPAVTRFVAPSPYVVNKASPSFIISGLRFYSASGGLGREEVEGRIMDILKNYDKVQDASRINTKSHFGNDLGLDSLDTVEVVMAIEEEFSIEIPDKESDAIHSIDQAVEYILSQPDAH